MWVSIHNTRLTGLAVQGSSSRCLSRFASRFAWTRGSSARLLGLFAESLGYIWFFWLVSRVSFYNLYGPVSRGCGCAIHFFYACFSIYIPSGPGRGARQCGRAGARGAGAAPTHSSPII